MCISFLPSFCASNLGFKTCIYFLWLPNIPDLPFKVHSLLGLSFVFKCWLVTLLLIIVKPESPFWDRKQNFASLLPQDSRHPEFDNSSFNYVVTSKDLKLAPPSPDVSIWHLVLITSLFKLLSVPALTSCTTNVKHLRVSQIPLIGSVWAGIDFGMIFCWVVVKLSRQIRHTFISQGVLLNMFVCIAFIDILVTALVFCLQFDNMIAYVWLSVCILMIPVCWFCMFSSLHMF